MYPMFPASPQFDNNVCRPMITLSSIPTFTGSHLATSYSDQHTCTSALECVSPPPTFGAEFFTCHAQKLKSAPSTSTVVIWDVNYAHNFLYLFNQCLLQMWENPFFVRNILQGGQWDVAEPAIVFDATNCSKNCTMEPSASLLAGIISKYAVLQNMTTFSSSLLGGRNSVLTPLPLSIGIGKCRTASTVNSEHEIYALSCNYSDDNAAATRSMPPGVGSAFDAGNSFILTKVPSRLVSANHVLRNCFNFYCNTFLQQPTKCSYMLNRKTKCSTSRSNTPGVFAQKLKENCFQAEPREHGVASWTFVRRHHSPQEGDRFEKSYQEECVEGQLHKRLANRLEDTLLQTVCLPALLTSQCCRNTQQVTDRTSCDSLSEEKKCENAANYHKWLPLTSNTQQLEEKKTFLGNNKSGVASQRFIPQVTSSTRLTVESVSHPPRATGTTVAYTRVQHCLRRMHHRLSYLRELCTTPTTVTSDSSTIFSLDISSSTKMLAQRVALTGKPQPTTCCDASPEVRRGCEKKKLQRFQVKLHNTSPSNPPRSSLPRSSLPRSSRKPELSSVSPPPHSFERDLGFSWQHRERLMLSFEQNQTLAQKRLSQSRSLVYSASTVIKPTTAGGEKPKPLKRNSLRDEAHKQLSVPKSHVKQVTSNNKDIRTKNAKTTPTVVYDLSPSKKSYYRPTQASLARMKAHVESFPSLSKRLSST